MTKQKSLNFLIRLFTLTASLLFPAELAMGLPEPPAGKEWDVVENLTDEFDTWDSSKWHKSLWNYGVPVQMRAENSGVADGNLWIKATLDEGAERWFETSRVMSNTQIIYPMYTECSMRTAHISAYNTFWLNNGDIDNRDEFDICENNSKPSYTSQTYRPYTMYSQYFIVKDGVTERAAGDFDNRNLSVTNALRGVPWNEAYHTLGAWWIDKNNIQFYLDGEPAGSVVTIQDFTLEQNVIWDLWTIDAAWAGGIANQADLLDDSINTMYVDWIHTYKLVDTPPVIDSIQADASGITLGINDGPSDGYVHLLSKTDIMDTTWTTNRAYIPTDSAGYGSVTIPVSGSQEFYQVMNGEAPVLTVLTSADFESGFGEWVNVTDDDSHDWTRDSGGTSSGNTGPDSGASNSTWYVYFEASGSSAGDNAILEGPDLIGDNRTLTFFYHMFGDRIGELNVDVYSEGSWSEGIWSISGEQHTSYAEEYTKATVDLSAYSGTIRIRFRMVAAGGIDGGTAGAYAGDMAIDDIKVTSY